MGVVNLRFDDEEARGGPENVAAELSRVGEVGKGVKSDIVAVQVPRGGSCLLKIGFSALLFLRNGWSVCRS